METPAKPQQEQSQEVANSSQGKHTPGPWVVSEHNQGTQSDNIMRIQRVVSASTGVIVYQVGGVNAKADAQLIATAPELLDTLTRIVNSMKAIPWATRPAAFDAYIKLAEPVIAKANL